MSFSTLAENMSAYRNEDKPWEGFSTRSLDSLEGTWISPRSCRSQSIDDLEGTWVNVDCPFEHYTVQGHNVTRTDVRGTQHFTLHWDYEGQRWQWGTHGRLSLEWLDNDVISWVPDLHANNAKVWHWRRSGPPPPQPAAVGHHGGVVPPLALAPSTYGPGRRPRSSQHQWVQPYPTSNINWCMTPSAPPPRVVPYPGSAGVPPPQWFERVQRSWDFVDESQHYPCHYHHDQRYQREYHHQRNHYGYHNWRPRSSGYAHFGGPVGVRLPCGLTTGEVSELLYRDITPEDYDLLLLLDKEVPKPTASTECIKRLPAVSPEEFMIGDGECSVCLCKFEAGDDVAALPCQHRFHRTCVTKWLAECRRMCPLCGVEVVQSEEAATPA